MNATIPERPYLKPWWRLVHQPDRTFFHYGDGVVRFNGRAVGTLFPLLLPLLDGKHDLDAIVGEIGTERRPLIEKALELLTREGVVTDGAPPRDDVPVATVDAARFIAATQRGESNLEQDAAALRRLQAGIVGDSVAAREIARALVNVGANVSPLAWTSAEDLLQTFGLVIVAPSARELHHLRPWNARALTGGIAWLQVLPFDGRFATIGPLYLPNETCCYECYALRRAANVTYPREFWEMQDTPAAYPSTMPFELALAGIATTMILRYALRGDASLLGRLYALEAGNDIALSDHTVYRVPRCPECARVAKTAAPAPWFEAV